jgi:CheY-like chemotaxis protein
MQVMNNKPYILTVDDEDINRQIMVDLLSDEFEIATALNGEECLHSVEKRTPDLILLDVNMPVMNGLAACQLLRKKPQTQNTPIIFVSALTSPKERLAGYTAGGDDYLIKPFDEDELKSKMAILLTAKSKLDEETQSNLFATQTAMSAMTSSAELGLILQFIKTIIVIDDIQALKNVLIDTLHNLGLEGCILLEYQDEPTFTSTDGRARPIEVDVLLETRRTKKIIEFGVHAVFCSQHSSILVRRMPQDDDKRGRYKDHLAILIDSLEEKLIQFNASHKRELHLQIMKALVGDTGEKLSQVTLSYQEQRIANNKVLALLIQDMEETFMTMGLDELQEQTLMKLLTNAESQVDRVYEQGKGTSLVFDAIVADLNSLLIQS